MEKDTGGLAAISGFPTEFVALGKSIGACAFFNICIANTNSLQNACCWLWISVTAWQAAGPAQIFTMPPGPLLTQRMK